MPSVIPFLELERRGATREQILAFIRNSLRDLPDPSTGVPFGEDEIRQATIRGSRYWVGAESIDLIVQSNQTRAEFFAEQIDPRRASTAYLEKYHGPQAKLPRLEDEGATGLVTCEATPGSIFIGNSEPDELATRATMNGLLFQVLFDATTPSSGVARVVLKGIDGGIDTRLRAEDVLQWVNPPPGAGDATVVEDFVGGSSLETDAEWGERLFDARGSRAKSGNAAHVRLWARSASSSVDKPYVYPCGLGSGTVVVALTQKRAGVAGPFARIPSLGLMTVVIGYLTPPGSAEFPGQARVIVVPVRPQSTSGSIRLGLKHGGPAGWVDLDPWPRLVSQPAEVVALPAPTQSAFTMRADTSLPATGVPQLMAWDPALARFEKLQVVTVSPGATAGTYDVALAQEPAVQLAAGVRISPYAGRAATISKGIERYFDSLGPGELVAPSDARFAEAHRRPASDLQEPAPAGERVVSFISQALGGSVERGSVFGFTPETPSVPVFSPSQGPYLLVPQHVAVYPV